MRLLRISQKCFTEITAISKNNIKIDDELWFSKFIFGCIINVNSPLNSYLTNI
jgi:hypothetical protein